MARAGAPGEPAAERARALGARVPRGEHAVAFAVRGEAALLAGFVFQGLREGEQVLVVHPQEAPAHVTARLRAQGVAPPRGQPGALLAVRPPGDLGSLPPALEAEVAGARAEGFAGMRVAVVVPGAAVRQAKAMDACLPRRFQGPLTVLCVYTPHSLLGLRDRAAWALARRHGRILVV